VGLLTRPAGLGTRPEDLAPGPMGLATRPVGPAMRPEGLVMRPKGFATRPVGPATRPVSPAMRPKGLVTRPVGLLTRLAGPAAQPLGRGTRFESGGARFAGPAARAAGLPGLAEGRAGCLEGHAARGPLFDPTRLSLERPLVLSFRRVYGRRGGAVAVGISAMKRPGTAARRSPQPSRRCSTRAFGNGISRDRSGGSPSWVRSSRAGTTRPEATTRSSAESRPGSGARMATGGPSRRSPSRQRSWSGVRSASYLSSIETPARSSPPTAAMSPCSKASTGAARRGLVYPVRRGSNLLFLGSRSCRSRLGALRPPAGASQSFPPFVFMQIACGRAGCYPPLHGRSPANSRSPRRAPSDSAPEGGKARLEPAPIRPGGFAGALLPADLGRVARRPESVDARFTSLPGSRGCSPSPRG
jgi:hypothetical protein